MHIIFKKGSQNNRLRFSLHGADGRLITGLDAQAPGLAAAVIRESDHPNPIALVSPAGPGFVPGTLSEIDPVLMPGLYELALPDEICAPGAQRATLMIRAPQIQTKVIQIDLVAYDPYDQDRLGLDCLSRDARHEVISRAFREVVPEIVAQFLEKK